MIDDIIKLVDTTRTDMISSLPIIDNEIDNIIGCGIQSQRRIEKLLDVLLDYGYMGIGKERFQKLNSYYATFNKEYSDEYFEFYKDIEKEE